MQELLTIQEMEEKMKKNNLFQYATSELSQDAFLAWSINWLNYKEEPLYEYGKAMLDLLLSNEKQNSYHKVEVLRQYKNIDVLIYFEDDKGKPHALIIEDKIDTSEHGDQMIRYAEKLNEENKKRTIHLAYVKTGIIYDDERCNMQDKKATTVDLDDLLRLTSDHCVLCDSEILSDFNVYIQKIKKERDLIEKQIEEKCEYEEALKDPCGYGQFYFLDKIFDCRERKKIGNMYINLEEKKNMPLYTHRIYSGVNNDGTPWTQYSIWGEKYPNNYLDENKNEYHYLFWRIDSHKCGSYIALRHYDEIRGKNEHTKERKRIVYREFRRYADEKYNNNNEYREKTKQIGKRENYNESDLIYIPIEKLKSEDSKNMKFADIKTLIKKITDSFIEKFNDGHDLYDGLEEKIKRSLPGE
jgi:hypothetical protein